MRALILFSALAFWAWASVGQLSGLRGEASVLRGDRKITATIGMALEQGDAVKTASGSQAQLLFHDDTVITIGPDSDFRIEAFDYAGVQPKARFAAAKGALRVMTGQISKAAPQNFELKTRTATIGIRGTHFLGVIGSEQDTVACTDGAIVVGSQTAEGSVNVRAGQLTQVALNQPPLPPRDFTPTELKGLTSQTEGNGGAKGEGGEREAPDEAEAESDVQAKQTVAVETEVVQSAAKIMGASWFWAWADFYGSEEDFNYYWGGESDYAYQGVSYSSTRLSSPTPYISWGFNTLKIDASEWAESESVDFGRLEIAEYWAYPSTGYSLTSDLPHDEIRTYRGGIAGAVGSYSENAISKIGDIRCSNCMNLSVDFSLGSATADMSFSAGGSQWNTSFTGSIDSSLYLTADNGSASGEFVGENAEAVGGSFSLYRYGSDEYSHDYAVGVFALEQIDSQPVVTVAKGALGSRLR